MLKYVVSLMLLVSGMVSANTYYLTGIDKDSGDQIEIGIYTTEGNAKALSLYRPDSDSYIAMDQKSSKKQKATFSGVSYDVTVWEYTEDKDTIQFTMMTPSILGSDKQHVHTGMAMAYLNGEPVTSDVGLVIIKDNK